jgi:hypothetical protein
MERPGVSIFGEVLLAQWDSAKMESFGIIKGMFHLRPRVWLQAGIEAVLGPDDGAYRHHLCALPSAWRRRFLATQRGMWGTCLEGCHLLICIQYLG